MLTDFEEAKRLLKERIGQLRAAVPPRRFDHRRPAEVEINSFWLEGKTVDRIMVVLRATGCEYYLTGGGCSMCAHYDGTTDSPVSASDYVAQWNQVIDGSALESQPANFDMNNYPILCLYNLGSFLNPKEVDPSAVREIFRSISSLRGIKKIIIESRAEYVTSSVLENIRQVHPGTVEVGIGLESAHLAVRELCHHKNLPDLETFVSAVATLHQHGFRALTYVNQKPPFLTEAEAVNDAIETSIFAFHCGADAVSIEPTSLQAHSLVDYLHSNGLYRVPWLWSVREVVRGVTDAMGDARSDLRLGGYFDEEILSGSQGVAPGVQRNELFPHTTAGNCRECDGRMIAAIKEYNKVCDPAVLHSEPPCDCCYDEWRLDMSAVDTRSIPRRVIETLHRLGQEEHHAAR